MHRITISLTQASRYNEVIRGLSSRVRGPTFGLLVSGCMYSATDFTTTYENLKRDEIRAQRRPG